jgi:glycine/D-amino acid oxidase-like deaminating enzyme
MLELAKERGVRFIGGKAIEVEKSDDGRATGVTYIPITNDKQKVTIPATDVILCAGAWSNTLPGINIPSSAVRAHSITIRPSAEAIISPYVLFTEITLPPTSSGRGVVVEPEIYARPDNEVYVCGPGDDEPLPETVDGVIVDEKECDSIRQHVASISQELRDGKVEKRQACFLPVVAVRKKGPGRKFNTIQGPIIGEARMFAKGLFVATGHTCWVRILFLSYC